MYGEIKVDSERNGNKKHEVRTGFIACVMYLIARRSSNSTMTELTDLETLAT
jgi:hypothetical protein